MPHPVLPEALPEAAALPVASAIDATRPTVPPAIEGASRGAGGEAPRGAPPNPTDPAPRPPDGGRYAMTLDGGALGPLHVAVELDGDAVRVALLSARDEATEIVRRHAAQIADDLRQGGFAQATVTADRDGRPPPSPSPPPAPPPDAPGCIVPDAIPQSRPGAHGRLDLRL